MSDPFSRSQRRFNLRGLNVAKPIDALGDGEYPTVQNVRSYVTGTITSRPGQTAVNATPIADPIHTIRRLNDSLPGATQAFARILGGGTSLYSDNAAHTAFASRATGFSGNPLSITPFQPLQSPDSWAYVGDGSKMIKVRTDGSTANHGGVPPNAPPTGVGGDPMPTINALQFTTILGPGPPLFVLDGTIFKGQTVLNPTDTIVAVLFDAGSTGWMNVVYNTVNSPQSYQPGAIIEFPLGFGPAVIIDSVYGPTKTTTIASIAYDSGSSGLCTIVPTAPKAKALIPNAIIRVNGEYVRVINTTWGKDDLPSVRCSTTLTHHVGDPIIGVSSWRAYSTVTHGIGDSYFFDEIVFFGLPLATGTTGVGTAFAATSLDLSVINGRPLQDDDMLTFVLFITDPLAITEVQFAVMMDSAPGAAPVNYYQVSVRPSDFQPVSSASQTTLSNKQRKIQRQAIDTAAVPPGTSNAQFRQQLQLRQQKASQAGNMNRADAIADRLAALDQLDAITATSSQGTQAGTSQWVEFQFKVSEVTRFGNDLSLDWANITGMLFRVLYSNQTGANDTAQIALLSAWIGGSFGPDIGDSGQPFQYRYRYRSSTTGTKTAYGPATRSGVSPRRSRVQLVPTASADAQFDKIDWARFGGNLSQWNYIGTGPNTTATFNDDFPESSVTGNAVPDIDFAAFQPYPTVGLPVTGTCNTGGTTVTATGGLTFNVNWAQGTQVIVNNVLTTIYRVISTSAMEVVDNLGANTSTTFFCPEPLVLGTALAFQWGPFGQGLTGAVLFAVGDKNNPGTLYWTNFDDPDSASDANQLVVTSPSEDLINGLLFDGKSYVFSSDNLYEIYPDLGGTSPFVAIKSSCGRGMYGNWNVCTGGGYIWFRSKDGIYRTQGGPAEKVSQPLEPLFPSDKPGATTSSIIAPDDSQLTKQQLHWGAGSLRFDYLGLDGNQYTLVYRDDTGWGFDSYARQVITSYYEEGQTRAWLLGANNGKLYLNTGTSDDGVAISCIVQTGAMDEGDARTRKLFGDLLLDADPQNGNGINVAARANNLGTNLTTFPGGVTGTGRAQTVIDISDGLTLGAGFYARNIAAKFTWAETVAVPVLYLWEDSFVAEPEDSALRRTEFDDLGYPGMKFIQGVVLKADTGGVVRTVNVLADNGTNGAAATNVTLTVTHAGISEIAHPLAGETWVPFQAHGVKLQPTDAGDSWRLFPQVVRWVWEPAPELATNWQTQQFSFDGYWHVRDGQIAYMGATAAITVTLLIDGTSYPYVITPPDTAFHKFYLDPLAVKGKACTFQASSTQPFQLFVADSYFRIGEWGRGDSYQTLRPFGGQSRAVGAAI